MVCDQTDGYIVCIIILICLMADLTDLIAQCTDRIYIKDGIYILYNAGQTLQTHTGIDIFLFQCGIVTVTIVFELGKYIIPDLHVTVTVTAYGTARLATAILFSTIVINLRTRTTRTCTMLPEVIFFAKAEDFFSRNTDFFIPDIKRLVILQIYGWIQTVRIKSDHLCQKFPGPVNGFPFEVISKRKVTQHLKKCTMTCCLTDIFDITGTDTFLACGHTSSRWDLSSCKIWL